MKAANILGVGIAHNTNIDAAFKEALIKASETFNRAAQENAPYGIDIRTYTVSHSMCVVFDKWCVSIVIAALADEGN